ncbi:APC family permease [Prauserella alba]|uniref:Amino acid permease/ SLC12A domain-containing protein n=1 Tax=Prauserella alba TaxID=176898 RepID=A0ABN1VBZ4_9PSEU|nr:hypothetical protein [Prauserella alba]MCP2179039.1 amino acid exporter, AAE family [Prauserella alba]
MTGTGHRGLGRVAAIPLAFGSIAGSGILSLPSAVYAETGPASLLVWLLSGVLCVPMLVMFRDTVRLSPNGDALQALVTRGLGDTIGRAMPLMFLFVVVLGLPTGCIVAGRYVERGLGVPGATGVVAAALLLTALLISAHGAGAKQWTQLAGSAALTVTGVALVLLGTLGSSDSHPTSVDLVPGTETAEVLLPGVLLAFWAFVGFENLTFLARELREPRRDFLPVSIAALALYGFFAVALTVTVALSVPRSDVDPVAGLLQIAQTPPVPVIVAVVAVSAMLINAAAWVRGLGTVLSLATADGTLPRRTPAPLVTMGALFSVTLAVLLSNQHLTVDALAASSAVFVLIYAVCIVGYVRLYGFTVRTAAGALLLVVMAASLVQSGTRSLYGVAVAACCLAWCAGRRRRARVRS